MIKLCSLLAELYKYQLIIPRLISRAAISHYIYFVKQILNLLFLNLSCSLINNVLSINLVIVNLIFIIITKLHHDLKSPLHFPLGNQIVSDAMLYAEWLVVGKSETYAHCLLT